ncbi:MAG TPA: cytochrome P450, partial [Solirubrobacteraceae bacterium]
LPRPVQTLAWMKRPGPFLERCRRRYGDTFTLRIAYEGHWVMLTDPEAIREVFTGDPRVLHAGEANTLLRPILGPSSVLLLDDDAHLSQRKLMLPPFHGERMRRYGALMTEIAEAEVATWPAGEPLALAPRMQRLTLEIILRAVFGIREADRLDRLRVLLTRMLDWLTRPSRFAAMALLGPTRLEQLGVFDRVIGPVDELLLDEIARRRADPGVAERDDILSLLVQATHEDGTPMGDRELRDELITLLVAGHETTANSLAWALERLLRHPTAWERLRDEAAAGEDAYVEATVRETLRLRPVLPLVARMLKAPMTVGGRDYPAGATLCPCIYLVHRRADVYPDPYAFRPERFLDATPGTYTWIPFGGGVRRCLGASFALFEMTTVLRVVAGSAALRAAHPERDERVRRRAIMLTPDAGAEVVRDEERVAAPA